MLYQILFKIYQLGKIKGKIIEHVQKDFFV